MERSTRHDEGQEPQCHEVRGEHRRWRKRAPCGKLRGGDDERDRPAHGSAVGERERLRPRTAAKRPALS